MRLWTPDRPIASDRAKASNDGDLTCWLLVAFFAGHERVVSVFKDRALQLHTTRSWDFLEVQSGLQSGRLGRRASGDVIMGIVDTGVWPESPSFNDAGMRDVPARWRGVCMEGPDFKKSNCNKYQCWLASWRFVSAQENF